MSEVSTGSSAPATDSATSTTSQIQESGSELKESDGSATAEQTQAAKKKYKLKVDGEEFEEEFDPSDDAAVTRELQLSRAAKKRMAEANADKKKAFDVLQRFEADPQSFLRNLGPKGQQIAEEFLMAKIQDDMLTPQEKEFRQMKHENETYKKNEAHEKEESEAKVQSEKDYNYAQTAQATIIQALDKSGLPRTPAFIKEMARTMYRNLELGLELTVDDLVQEVKGDETTRLRSIIKDASGEQLIELLGPDIANKIRKSDLKKLQERQGQVFQGGKRSPQPASQPAKPQRPETLEEWQARISRNIQE